MPLKLTVGVNTTLPLPFSATVPPVPAATLDICKELTGLSTSVSLARSAAAVSVTLSSSRLLMVSPLATGASSIEPTRTVAVVVAVPPAPSLTT